MKSADTLLKLIALKEQIEDLIDQARSPAKTPAARKKSAKSGQTRELGDASSNKLAIVVGHTQIAPGASGIAPVNASEHPWNTDLAQKIAVYGAGKGVQVQTFFRDVGGISGAYAAVRAWGARAAIELHFNAADGTARGTETLYGTACSTSAAWAGAVQSALVTLYNRTGSSNRGLKKCLPHPRGGASVNALSDIPSCLIEPFFGDNTTDAALGQSNKEDQARALVDAFKSHFGI